MSLTKNKISKLEHVTRGRAAEAAEAWVLEYVEKEQGKIMALLSEKIGRGVSEINMEAAMLVELRNMVLTLQSDITRGTNSG